MGRKEAVGASRISRSHAGLRQVPTQIRAQETVEHIVATAGELLAEVGIQGFNTNLLAARAGVKVPTVYRYFPNKIAVIKELARRLIAAWNLWLDAEQLADPANDWRDVWTGYLDTFVAGVAAAPAGLAIRAALHSVPELREMQDRDVQRFVDRIARALLRRNPTLDRRQVSSAAEILMTTAIAVVDKAFTGPANRRARLIGELKQMQLAYLATLLD